MVESQQKLLWSPDSLSQKTQMALFQNFIGRQHKIDIANYWDLHQFSIEQPELFWSSLVEFLEVRWQFLNEAVYEQEHEESPFLSSRWFSYCSLNFAENLLSGPERDDAIISIVEGLEKPVKLSLADLKVEVAILSCFLRRKGVIKGTRVAAVVGNTVEALVGMLATTALGGVWSSCSPDFGSDPILQRFRQVDPEVLFFTHEYQYNGKTIDCSGTMTEVRRELPSLKTTIIVDPLQSFAKDIRDDDSLYSYNEIRLMNIVPDLSFASVGFNDPLFIMFSSGTTGAPKCIVHGVGGTLIQHRKEHQLHCDLGPSKRLMFFTTCGWMMWNWMVSALASGSDLLLFEGSPSYPDVGLLWELAEQYKVHSFGTSPKFLSACEAKGFSPKEKCDLGGLYQVLSTGAPLLPEQFDWFYEHVGGEHRLVSISGGTDIISCFMLGVPNLPIYRGVIQAAGLGMAVESWVNGQSMIDQKGELVCIKPFPSQPLGFLNDDNQERYANAYFREYSDREVWHHGDFIEVTQNKGIIVHGRSDATLNPGGVRIGTAEIYRAVESCSGVLDSLCIGRPVSGDSEILLFVQTDASLPFEGVASEIKSKIKTELTARHLPKHIFSVGSIPYTRSGKKLEIPITRIFAGDGSINKSTAVDESSFDQYEAIHRQLEGEGGAESIPSTV